MFLKTKSVTLQQSWYDTNRRGALLRQQAVAIVLIAAVAFNFGLCFINTNIHQVNAAAPMAAEGAIILSALILLMYGPAALFARATGLLACLLLYFILLYVGRLALDPKPFRDLAIPIVFVVLGVAYPNPRVLNRTFAILTLFVLAVGIWEYSFLDSYLKWFNIARYFLDKGATDASLADMFSDGLSINGARPLSQGRELLPWLLTGHRSSSIFLEPVTAGNFGAIAAAWFLHHERRVVVKCLWLAACATIIILADGRFGLLLYILAIVTYLGRRYLRVRIVAFTPVLVAVFLLVRYLLVGENTFPNTFAGRLDYAGHLFTKIGLLDWFGVTTVRPLYDAGYAYAVTQFGLLGTVVLWVLFAAVAVSRSNRNYFINYSIIYFSLALMTSGSVYSIKASSLMWFAIGTALSSRRTTATDTNSQWTGVTIPPFLTSQVAMEGAARRPF